MTAERGAAPALAGASAQVGSSVTQAKGSRANYSRGQRNAATWAVRHATLWREERDSERRIRTLEEEVAELRRLVRGEQVP